MPPSLPLFYRILPTSIDLLTIAGYYFLVPPLAALFLAQSVWNHAILLPGYLLLIIGVIAIRKLPSYSVDESEQPGILGACLAFFMVVIFGMLYTTATNLGGTGKGNDTATVVIFFVFLFPFLMSFFLDVKRTENGTKEAIIVESISTAIANYFTLMGAAVWYCFSSMEVPEDARYATGISHLILWAILVLIFLAFFGLPRIYLLVATGNLRGFVAYVIGVAVFLWTRVPAL